MYVCVCVCVSVCVCVCVCVCLCAYARVCESDVSVSVPLFDLSLQPFMSIRPYAIQISINVSAFCANILVTACVWLPVTTVVFNVLE